MALERFTSRNLDFTNQQRRYKSGKMMEKDEIISVDSAKAGGDKTFWTTNGTDKLVTVGHSQGWNTVNDIFYASNTAVVDAPSELRALTDRLDQYTRLSENLIFRNARGWNEPGYWANDRLKELIAEYPEWKIVVDNDLTRSVILIPMKDMYEQHYASLSSAQDASIAITYILDMLVVTWHDKEWPFTFEKQDKDSFLKDFERVIKIITSILDYITKRRKEDENMKKSLDIIAAGTCYK